MARCEDFPCCGHELGCCPDYDEAGNQLNMVCTCGAKLPINSRYSICRGCMERGSREDGEDGYEEYYADPDEPAYHRACRDLEDEIDEEIASGYYVDASLDKMLAYPDSKCSYGYMCVCHDCLHLVPSWVDINNPIENPPARGKAQPCEMCHKKFMLVNPVDISSTEDIN